MTERLNLPEFDFKFRSENNKTYIFDEFRKKWVTLTPEEWVRQNFLLYLHKEKEFPKSLIAVEVSIKSNQLEKRCDIVVYNRNGAPEIIVECKATSVKISQDVFDQIASYNIALQVKYLIVTNGINHYCCEMNYSENSYKFVKEIPGNLTK